MKKYLAVLCLVAMATPSAAASINGRWVMSGYSCSKAIDATMSVAPDSWDGDDWSCSVTKTKNGDFSRSCQQDDVEWSDVVSANVTGNTLTISGDGETTTYTRCPD